MEVEVIETGKHFMKSKLVEASSITEPGLVKPFEKGEVSGLPKQLPEENKVSFASNTLDSFMIYIP